jgi:hypothetical protein
VVEGLCRAAGEEGLRAGLTHVALFDEEIVAQVRSCDSGTVHDGERADCCHGTAASAPSTAGTGSSCVQDAGRVEAFARFDGSRGAEGRESTWEDQVLHGLGSGGARREEADLTRIEPSLAVFAPEPRVGGG